MIARIVIYVFLLIVLPDLYIDFRYLRTNKGLPLWKRLVWWIPGMLMLAYTIYMVSLPGFIPADYWQYDLYMLLLGVLVLPKVVFLVFSFIHRKLAVAIAILVAIFYVYGTTVGFSKLEVKHVTVPIKGLPKAFDGYRVALLSDWHVGSYTGWREYILERAVDSVLAQQADLILFTGDLQNIHPREIQQHADVLKRLQAKDGIYSVLGNHDYAGYIRTDSIAKARQEEHTVIAEQQLGWKVLQNESACIMRKSGVPDESSEDKIYIVGTNNDGRPPFISKADYQKAYADCPSGACSIMLQHDPSAWQRNILRQTPAQLTLSGHTHGGQMSIFGWHPTELSVREDYGLFEQVGRYLYVSGGLGGIVPFKLGMAGEIIILTLRCE